MRDNEALEQNLQEIQYASIDIDALQIFTDNFHINYFYN